MLAHEGIMAVATRTPSRVQLFTDADEDHRGRLLELAMSLAETSQHHVHMVIKPYGIIHADPVGDIGAVAVLAKYGHPVSKSVLRMARSLGSLLFKESS